MRKELNFLSQLLDNLFDRKRIIRCIKNLLRHELGVEKWVFYRFSENGISKIWGTLELREKEKKSFSKVTHYIRRGKYLVVPVYWKGKQEALFVCEAFEKASVSRRKVYSLARFLLAVRLAIEKFEEIEKESEVFRAIRELSSSLSLPLDWKDTIRQIVEAIKKILKARTVALYLLDKEKKSLTALYAVGYRRDAKSHLHLKYGKGLVGWAAETGRAILVPDVRKEKRYYKVREKTLSELVVPVKFGNEVIGVINVEDDRLNYFSEREKKLLEVFASYAAITIERAKVYQEMIAQEKTLKELEVARRIQFRFLPQKDPTLKEFYVSGKEIPAFKVGGDYFDFFWIGKRKLAVAIADVVGKGIPAALMMASFRSAVRILLDEYSLEEAARKVNEFVYNSTASNQFITSVLGILDVGEKKLDFVNAGHNYPVVLKGDRVEVLEYSDLVFGVKRKVDYRTLTISFEEVDAIYLYTDGVVEQINPEGEEFGMRRFLAVLREFCNDKPSNTIKELVRRLKDFCRCENFSDDVTIIGIKRKDTDEVGN